MKYYTTIFLGIVLFFACNENEMDKKYYVEEYHKNGNIDFQGYVNKEMESIGEWVYYNPDKTLLAKGTFNNDLQEGIWEYGKKVFNGKKQIKWTISETENYKLSLPEEFKIDFVEIDSTKVFRATFDSLPTVNLNITFLNYDGVDLDIYLKKEFAYLKQNYSTEVFEEEEIKVDLKPAKRIRLKGVIDGRTIVGDQYYINSNVKGGTYLVSCHYPINMDSDLYHQVFSEIAFSFIEKE